MVISMKAEIGDSIVQDGVQPSSQWLVSIGNLILISTTGVQVYLHAPLQNIHKPTTEQGEGPIMGREPIVPLLNNVKMY